VLGKLWPFVPLKDQTRLIKEAKYEESCISYRVSCVICPRGRLNGKPGIGLSLRRWLWWQWRPFWSIWPPQELRDQLWNGLGWLRSGLLCSDILCSSLLRPHVLWSHVLPSPLSPQALHEESGKAPPRSKSQEDKEIVLTKAYLLRLREFDSGGIFKGMINSRKAELHCFFSGRNRKDEI
jgi:hypothetical protein